ncbi:hypothetical protein ACIBI4_22920 [Streptomyces sp. NPDC050418]|uniref:hypothetical protein n=1 Tax=Streptomyces sp. NPDC050418 TaxID=3365612 RepID=UPI0037923770
MKRILPLGAALLALSAGATACTSSGSPEEAAPQRQSCGKDAYTWSSVQRRTELSGLAKPIHVTKDGRGYNATFEPVDGRSHKASVLGASAARGPRPADTVKALGRLLDVSPLGRPGEKATDPGRLTLSDTRAAAGHYFAYVYVPLVDADYTYRCGSAAPAEGHVSTWSGTGTAALPCSERIERNPADDPDLADVAHEAALARCPAGSPAAAEPAEAA